MGDFEDVAEVLEPIAMRFQGLSLDYRRTGATWPGHWRARMYAASDARDSYRITVYADDCVSVLRELSRQIRAAELEARSPR